MEPLERIDGFNTIAPANSARGYSAELPSVAFGASSQRNGVKGPLESRKTLTLRVSSLMRAMDIAADVTSTSIAEATRQPIEDVRDQLKDVTSWLASGALAPTTAECVRPPTVPRDYIAAFRK